MKSLLSVPALSELYDMVRPLRCGAAMGTMLATERGTGRRVVIKHVDCRSLTDEVKAFLRREVALVESSRDSEMAAVFGSVDGGDLYLVMPYAEGVTLRQRLLDRGPLTVEDALTVARQVLCHLRRMHAHGVVHRAVEPANIIVDERSPVRSATLVDLGFVSSAFLAPAQQRHLAAPPRYMAPELAGLLDRPVDGRSDLYSIGIVLFECLAGRPLFGGGDVREVLRHHLSTVAPPLRSLGVAVPQALEEIVRRLLHKDPDDRYQSAAAVLADADDLGDALTRGVVEPGVALGSHDRRVSLTEPPLTGRHEELAVLTARLADARRYSVRPVLLDAVSGGGKTRVLDEFCQRAAAAGSRVFRVAGIERSARQPLHMFGGVVRDLLAQVREEPKFGREVAAALSEPARTLCDALPGLNDLLGDVGALRSPMPERLVQVRLAAALVELLTALGSAMRPALVVFDDCQWADEVTLRVLEMWAGGAAPEDGRVRNVLVVVAMRGEEVGPHSWLKGVRGFDTVSLPPLDTDQIGEVIESMAGSVPAGVTQVVVDLSRGNPLMVGAVLRGLVEDTALSPSSAGWRFNPVPGGWQASREAAALLARRFSLLAPSTHRLLDAGAVLGRDFDPRLAARLVGEDEDTVENAIGPAIERHLVWPSSGGHVSFAHDRLRASLLAGLDPVELVELHRRAGEEIERTEPGRAFDLAYHYDAAGEPDRAFAYALGSARSARARYDVEVAERHYLIAERGMSTLPRRTQYSLIEEFGQVLMLRGRYDEAEQRFGRARVLAEDNLQRAWIECQLGELAFRRDDLDGAAAHMESGLRALGESVPLTGRGRIVLGIAREATHRLIWGGLRQRERRLPASEHPADLLKSHLYTRLQYPRWFHSRRLETAWLMLRQVNLAERCPDSEQLAHAYAVWGGAVALTFPFLWRGALPYVDHALSIYQSNGNLRGEGHAASMRACVLHAAGRYEDAAQSAQHAIRTLSQFGDRWELGFATRTRAVCLYRLGRLYEAQEEAHRLAAIGAEVGDVNAEITALEILAKTADGRVPAIETQAALSRRGDDIEVTVAALQAEALRLRHAGQLPEAVQRLDTAADLVHRAQPTSTHLVPVFAWLATCRRELAERQLLPDDRRRLLRASRRSALRAVRYGAVYPNDLPHALRELGVVHALCGHRRRARRCLDRSAAWASSRDARAELVETDLQRDRLRLADSSVDSPRARGPGGIAVERCALSTVGLAERFAALLDAGALLASCNSSEATVQAIRNISSSLLRAEWSHVVGLLAEERPDYGALSSDELAAIQRVDEHGRPVILTEPIVVDVDGVEGTTPKVARSALCTPVFAREKIVGYFFALHTQVGALFGEEERQLAEFVARLAGASLERQWLERDSRGRVVAAQEGERARVARDLHDEIGQALTSVLLHAVSVDSAVTGEERTVVDAAEVSRRVGELRQDAELALESVQRLAFDMRPAVLDDLGLVAALRRLLIRTATGGVEIELETVDLEPGDRLPHDIETTAYRVVQEAVTNVVRHSRASTCGVIIGRAQQRLRIVIEDDGRGFEGSADGHTEGHHGLGVQGMRERAALVGGALTVSSQPGRGTEIVFEVAL